MASLLELPEHLRATDNHALASGLDTTEMGVRVLLLGRCFRPINLRVNQHVGEEEVVVTKDGARVLTLFPAQDLFIANEY